MKKKTKKVIGFSIVLAAVVGGVWLGGDKEDHDAVIQDLASSSLADLPGLLSGEAPWSANQIQLRQRLQAIGLPALAAEGTKLHMHEHLDIFIHGKSVSVPAEIGVGEGDTFIASIHVHDADSIVHVESPTVQTFMLGQFFDTWGVRFDGRCIGGYCQDERNTVSVFVNGEQIEGDPRAVRLQPYQEIVVAFGAPEERPDPIPSSFNFPRGL